MAWRLWRRNIHGEYGPSARPLTAMLLRLDAPQSLNFGAIYAALRLHLSRSRAVCNMVRPPAGARLG
jgi:hypothetical protein